MKILVCFKAILLSCVFVFSGQSSFAQSDADLLHPQHAQKALNVLREEGLDSYLRYWRDNPEQALNLRSWCRAEEKKNGGVVSFPFEVHETAIEVIETLNELNREMGFTCYQVEAKINNEDYNKISEPTPKDKVAFERIRKARAATIPLLGYLITARPIYQSLAAEMSKESFAQHGGEFMQANMKGFLEFQFAYFSSLWSVIFSQKEFPFLKITAKDFFSKAAKTLSKPFNMLLSAANSFFKKTGNRVRASHVWISLVNLAGYPFAMGVALSLGEQVFGMTDPMNFGEGLMHTLSSGASMIRTQFAMSMAFNFTFMFFQDRTGAARNYNLWSEKSRLVAESIPAFLFNTFRGVSAIYPAFEKSMLVSQLAIGGVLSSLMAAKISGAKHFATETGNILTQMEKTLSPEQRRAVTTILLTAENLQVGSSTLLEQGHCENRLGVTSYIQARIFEYFERGFKSDALKKL
ncbi:hypothetical protein GW915_09610 [bacterium]|nr:hypothetical protein [bacterium]